MNAEPLTERLRTESLKQADAGRIYTSQLLFLAAESEARREEIAQWMDDASVSLGGSGEAAKHDPETRDTGLVLEGEAGAYRACAAMVRDWELPQEGREE